MAGAATKQKQSKRGEIIIALIGLAGVLITATLSNWDKLFAKENSVQVTYSGYRPTGNFETEFRYFIEVSGNRQAFKIQQHLILLKMKEDLLAKNPNSAEEIQKAINAAEEESIEKFDDLIRALLPVYQKHLTIVEIQELNKFFSTEVMQDLVKKLPLLTQDTVSIQLELTNDYLQRIDPRLREELGP